MDTLKVAQNEGKLRKCLTSKRNYSYEYERNKQMRLRLYEFPPMCEDCTTGNPSSFKNGVAQTSDSSSQLGL
ncbi:hypothetical protein CGMCC3_g12002 [Colletotrichum fructicola]|uniref:Uncharacterized protein n=1 Tax=Colletotrichum fructicola (strain Nara gc5) TaxID=1213859 RepID=A0A7J6IP84_COLFN|nr:uncharacterized protein CGMCC3_g12002 [Colletotrichum fructicola]KAE9571886.1 hypothetical protein CGMCC3_g12002 [Colletotrichum fructicola]KAF4478362.1 hypothetical protein CGGC5_v013206 [Colletotrichum fructicola Nara gc5]